MKGERQYDILETIDSVIKSLWMEMNIQEVRKGRPLAYTFHIIPERPVRQDKSLEVYTLLESGRYIILR